MSQRVPGMVAAADREQTRGNSSGGAEQLWQQCSPPTFADSFALLDFNRKHHKLVFELAPERMHTLLNEALRALLLFRAGAIR